MKIYNNVFCAALFAVAAMLMQSCALAVDIPTPKKADGLEYIDFGKGEYTLVFEAGVGPNSLPSYIGWTPYIPQLEKMNQRVIMYSRAGYKGSDPAPNGNYSVDAANARLKQLLTTLGVKDNIILIGHSYGGFLVRQYAYNNADAVVGLVLLDPSAENFDTGLLNLYKGDLKKRQQVQQQVKAVNQNLYSTPAIFPDGPQLVLGYAGGLMDDLGHVRVEPTVIVTSTWIDKNCDASVPTNGCAYNSVEGKAVWRKMHSKLIKRNPYSAQTFSNLITHEQALTLTVPALEQLLFMKSKQQ